MIQSEKNLIHSTLILNKLNYPRASHTKKAYRILDFFVLNLLDSILELFDNFLNFDKHNRCYLKK